MADAYRIAHRLNANQARCILDLSLEPTLLGCSVATAERLCKGGRLRPPLVVEFYQGRGEYKRHALNALGLEVQKELRRRDNA